MLTLFASILFLIVPLAGSINAASIRFEENEEMGCSILVEGVISAGDAEILANLINEQSAQDRANENMGQQWRWSPYGRRVCFNSPGGNMVEAMEMAAIISGYRSSRGPGGDQLGTAIGRNAQCESACALAFMAGSWGDPEGESVRPNRVMHPTARLGFHRPHLVVDPGNYSEQAVDEAFSVALETLRLIINARSQSWYDFPESLFDTMLSTSHTDMYFVRTVGEASRLSIQVAPSPFYNGTASHAILNFCTSVDGALLDIDPNTTYGGIVDGLDISVDTNFGAWTISSGFREEAVSGCSVTIHNANAHATDIVGYAFIGDYDVDRRRDVFPFQSFPSETPISALLSAYPLSGTEFVERVSALAAVVDQQSCWLSGASARITNVNQFTNLRAGAGISQPIVTRVPLNAMITPINQGGYYATQRCLQICDGSDQRQIAQCIENNEVWIEVNYNGRYGFVSRQFLVGP
jgi:hypothetical protein